MKMKNKRNNIAKSSLFSLYAIILIALVSCNNENRNVSLKLVANQHHDQYSDSSFVDSKISSIAEANGKYFICEQTNKRIVVINESMQYLYSIGKAGEGPGEFIFPVSCAVKNDSLYIHDAGRSKIIIYGVDGKFLREYNIMQAPPRGYSFGVKDNGTLVISLLHKDNPLHLLSNGRINKSFGEYAAAESETRKIRGGQRHVGIIGDILLSVPEADTYMELHDSEGNYISKLDLSSQEKIKNVIRYYGDRMAEEKDPAAVYVYFMGLSIYNNYVYVILNNLSEKKKYASLLVLELKEKEMIVKNIYDLNDLNGKEINLSHAVSANEKSLLISNRSGMYVYDISEIK